MIRDIESLIEYLYLKVSNPGLLWEKWIVNPTECDKCSGHIVIINKLYDLPIISDCSQLISRIPGLGFNVIPYDYELDNEFIKILPMISDRLEVFKNEELYYFSEVPKSLIKPGNCYSYLDCKLSNKLPTEVQLIE